MHHRVEDRDDVAIHLHRVGNQHRVMVHAQDPLGDAGLAVARAAIEEQRLVADQRRSELVEQAVGQHQVVKGLAQPLAAQPHLCRLRPDHLVILLDGDRRGPDVLAHLVARRCHVASGVAERERIIVPHHPFHFQQLLLAELVKEGLQEKKRELQSLVERSQRSGAVEPQVAQHQVVDQGRPNPQIVDAVGDPGAGLGPRFGQNGVDCGHMAFLAVRYRPFAIDFPRYWRKVERV